MLVWCRMHPARSLRAWLAILLPLQVLSAFPTPTPNPSVKAGPVIRTNFQDPSLSQHNGTWYAFAGANGNPPNINVQMATSPDFSTWTVAHGYDALPTLASWATNPGHLWSPDVNQLPDGSFVLYYSAATKTHPHQHCVGAAISKTIAGPYTPINATIACDHAKGGAIDPDGFVDINNVDAAHYVVYKVDGNSIGHGGACKNGKAPIVPTILMLQRVSSADGYTLLGNPVELLHNTPADGPNIEAPALVFVPASGLYFLFFNSGCFKLPRYRIEYATSKDLDGPYTRNPEPLLVTGDTAAHVQSPGGIDFSPNGTRIVFQGDLNMKWFTAQGKAKGNRTRGMYAASIMFNENNAQIVGLY
jgi:beta-xylosidase